MLYTVLLCTHTLFGLACVRHAVRVFPASVDAAAASHAPTDGVSVISHPMPLASPRDPTMLPALNKANPIGTAGFAQQPVVVGARAGYEDALASSDSDMEYFVDSDSDHSVHSRFSGKSNRSEKLSAEALIAPAPLPAISQASDAAVDRPSIATAADGLRDVGDGTDVPVDPAAVFVGDVDNHTIALRQQAVVDMLQFYSDRGDVQTCTTVMCVLSGSSLFPEAISEKQHLLWTRGYIGVSGCDVM